MSVDIVLDGGCIGFTPVNRNHYNDFTTSQRKRKDRNDLVYAGKTNR
jgi:hypothetical protein